MFTRARATSVEPSGVPSKKNSDTGTIVAMSGKVARNDATSASAHTISHLEKFSARSCSRAMSRADVAPTSRTGWRTALITQKTKTGGVCGTGEYSTLPRRVQRGIVYLTGIQRQRPENLHFGMCFRNIDISSPSMRTSPRKNVVNHERQLQRPLERLRSGVRGTRNRAILHSLCASSSNSTCPRLTGEVDLRSQQHSVTGP
jgi:hypothetical protein